MVITMKNINKSFKYNEVLKQLDLQIKKNELLLIQGDNGCGKSTLLKILAGLMREDSGEISISADSKIGAFIENPHFIENETAKYNMEFLYELTSSFQYDGVKKLFNRFYLDIEDKTNVKKYSVGMRQKLGIIQAVMEGQNLILFDEPTRGLDKKSMTVFNELIQELKEQGKTCVICAHDGVTGINFNRVLTMEDGVLNEKSDY